MFDPATVFLLALLAAAGVAVDVAHIRSKSKRSQERVDAAVTRTVNQIPPDQRRTMRPLLEAMKKH